jgi:hypothetical protein
MTMSENWRPIGHWEQEDLLIMDTRQATLDAQKLVSDIFKTLATEVGFDPKAELTAYQLTYLGAIANVTEDLDRIEATQEI